MCGVFQHLDLYILYSPNVMICIMMQNLSFIILISLLRLSVSTCTPIIH